MTRGAVAALAIAFGFFAGTPLRAEETVKVALGQRGNWETAAAELGQNAGFFKKRGLTLDLLYTQGSGETQQAVVIGSSDIGVGLGTGAVLGAFAKGAPIRAIGADTTGSSEYWYALASSPIHTMRDAAGKTIAFSTPGASSQLLVRGFMRYYNFEARMVATGGLPGTLTQVMSGQVDLGWATPPFALDQVEAGKIRIVGRGAELPYFHDQTIRLIVANAVYLDAHRDTVARFMQAYRDTLAWMYEDPAAVPAYAALAHVAESIVPKVRTEFYAPPALDPDRVTGLDAVQADAVSARYLPQPLSAAQLAALFQIPKPIN